MFLIFENVYNEVQDFVMGSNKRLDVAYSNKNIMNKNGH